MSSSDSKQAEGANAFEITVDRSDLVKELSTAQGVVERRSTIPILSNFLFETSGNKVLVTATDLDLSLQTFCTAGVRKPGSCTIPARKLYDYVKLLPDGEITIKALPNDWVQIRSGRSHTKMVALSRANFPNLPSFPKDSAIALPGPVLRTIIHRTIFAVSQEESKYTLNGALLILQPQGMIMVATDGHRLAHIQAKADVGGKETKVLMPKKALVVVCALLNSGDVESIEFAQDESTLFFRVGSRILTARQLTGSFPNYEAVMPRDYAHCLQVSNGEFSRAIQRVSQFADLRSSAVRLKMDKEQLRLSSSDPDTGESEETLEARYSGETAMIGFNSRYLLDFTRVTNTEKVTFHFKGPDAAAELRPDGDQSDYTFRYVVMPMRS